MNSIEKNGSSHGSIVDSKNNGATATKTAHKIKNDFMSRDNYKAHPDISWAVAFTTYLSYALLILVSGYSIIAISMF